MSTSAETKLILDNVLILLERTNISFESFALLNRLENEAFAQISIKIKNVNVSWNQANFA